MMPSFGDVCPLLGVKKHLQRITGVNSDVLLQALNSLTTHLMIYFPPVLFWSSISFWSGQSVSKTIISCSPYWLAVFVCKCQSNFIVLSVCCLFCDVWRKGLDYLRCQFVLLPKKSSRIGQEDNCIKITCPSEFFSCD